MPDDAMPVLRRGGRGRHSFVFSRSTGQLSWLGFQTFCSVPFLYELRQILDWSCTPTTLNLFDWLKLEVGSMCLCTVLQAVSSDMSSVAGMLCREPLIQFPSASPHGSEAVLLPQNSQGPFATITNRERHAGHQHVAVLHHRGPQEPGAAAPGPARAAVQQGPAGALAATDVCATLATGVLLELYTALNMSLCTRVPLSYCFGSI